MILVTTVLSLQSSHDIRFHATCCVTMWIYIKYRTLTVYDEKKLGNSESCAQFAQTQCWLIVAGCYGSDSACLRLCFKCGYRLTSPLMGLSVNIVDRGGGLTIMQAVLSMHEQNADWWLLTYGDCHTRCYAKDCQKYKEASGLCSQHVDSLYLHNIRPITPTQYYSVVSR